MFITYRYSKYFPKVCQESLLYQQFMMHYEYIFWYILGAYLFKLEGPIGISFS